MRLALPLRKFPAQEALLKSPGKVGCPTVTDAESPGSLSPAAKGTVPIAPTAHEPQGQSVTHIVYPTPFTVPGIQVAIHTCSLNNEDKRD